MTDPQDEAVQRQKVRELCSARPDQRPTDFINPLEKIEQLLTCAICLDRYKQPKLLPCHHTFCYPCLESCVDTLHRTLKCPECRAEHNVPYDGVKALPNNYTLTGFLDIHLQASSETAAELELYIHRYNLERCKVCDEKADCEPCAHCDRKACVECRKTHMDMLKRDMSRLLNQVRRLSNRIIEASDGLSKGLELLTLNTETTKDEVKEYFHRYYRDLKKREEAFLNEIETFQATESRLMTNLRDVLEIESSNMSEAVARLDAAIKGECVLEDTELVKLKTTFTEGIEYLRNFQPDADELFNRKVRFSAGEDAAKLPQAISTAGELCVLTPQFSGRYLPLEQSYLPRPFRLPLESDHYRPRERDERIVERPTSRHSNRLSLNATNEPDEGSIRYRRRQQLEEEAWMRLRGEGRSPWYKPPEMTSLNAAPESVVQPVQSKKEERNAALSLPPLPKVTAASPRTENITPFTAKPPPSPSATPIIRDEEKDEPRPFARKPPLPRQQSSNDDSLNEKVEVIRRAHAERQAASRAASESSESEGEEIARTRQRFRMVVREASLNRDLPPRQNSQEEGTPIPVTHFADEDSVVPPWLARRRQRLQRSRTNPDGISSLCSQRVQQLLQERVSRLDNSTETQEERSIRRRSASRDGGEWRARGRPKAIFGRKGGKEGELNWPRGVCNMPGGVIAVCDSSNHRVQIFDREGKFLKGFGGYGSGSGQLDSPAGIACSKQRLIVTDRYNHRVCFFDLDGRYLSCFGSHGQANAKFNNPWGVAVDELGTIYVVDKDNHRIQMFDKNGAFVGKFGSMGHGPGQLNNPLFVTVCRLNHQIYVSDHNNHRISVFDAQGQYLFAFGCEGFHGGQFKFPRGIAIDSQGNVLIADSGNNRIQVFTLEGEFISTFGSWGGGAGQLKGVEAIVVESDGNIVVSDRENHRMQIF